jgi:hypothetical protein
LIARESTTSTAIASKTRTNSRLPSFVVVVSIARSIRRECHADDIAAIIGLLWLTEHEAALVPRPKKA